MTTPKLWGGLEISDFLAVRAAILQVSRMSFNMPTLERLKSKKSIEQERKEAKEAGQRAEDFDPHSLLFGLLDWISIRKRAVVIIVATTGLIAHFGFGVSEESIVSVVSTTSSPMLFFGMMGLVLYVIWNFYVLTLHYNKKLIRNVNEHIRYSDQKIETEASVENVRAYSRWNSILSSNITLLCIFLLAVARSFFPSIFTLGTEASKDWVPEYVDTKVSDIVEDDQNNSADSRDTN